MRDAVAGEPLDAPLRHEALPPAQTTLLLYQQSVDAANTLRLSKNDLLPPKRLGGVAIPDGEGRNCKTS
jgi:hypothetical protein